MAQAKEKAQTHGCGFAILGSVAQKSHKGWLVKVVRFGILRHHVVGSWILCRFLAQATITKKTVLLPCGCSEFGFANSVPRLKSCGQNCRWKVDRNIFIGECHRRAVVANKYIDKIHGNDQNQKSLECSGLAMSGNTQLAET